MNRGHRLLPHTADVRFEAWAPTREECLAEAAAALVAGFADVTGVAARTTRTARLPGATDEDVLLALLDEIVYLLDTEDAVPLRAEVTGAAGDASVRLDLAPLDRVEVIGAAPKAVSLHDLRFERATGGWWCTATVDV
ncbi:archease [Saccharopolyspora rosea]|uniref:Archease n=1 Tax=Saccharopolyspora rosea TaxID=524884 RepID=A0ABW3FPV1_9PSEU|nr:archease [Saccharopolyspora rosea]